MRVAMVAVLVVAVCAATLRGVRVAPAQEAAPDSVKRQACLPDGVYLRIDSTWRAIYFKDDSAKHYVDLPTARALVLADIRIGKLLDSIEVLKQRLKEAKQELAACQSHFAE